MGGRHHPAHLCAQAALRGAAGQAQPGRHLRLPPPGCSVWFGFQKGVDEPGTGPFGVPRSEQGGTWNRTEPKPGTRSGPAGGTGARPPRRSRRGAPLPQPAAGAKLPPRNSERRNRLSSEAAALGEGRAGLWRSDGLRMTKSSPCLKEPAVAVIGNRKQTSEVCGEIPLAQPISEAAQDRALLFLKGCRFVRWNKRLFFHPPRYTSDFSKLQHRMELLEQSLRWD